MTTRIERTFEVDAPIDELWSLLANAELRAEAISVVDSYHIEGDEIIWNLAMPIRALPGSVKVRTRDIERDPPRFVRFSGRSRVMDVEGEHELTAIDGGTRVRNRFVVDGRLPGVEAYFKRNFDAEIENLARTVADRLSESQRE